MKAFVAGATGLTGRYVVEALVESGVTTIAHVRPDSNSKERWQAHFNGLGATVDTTPWTPEAMSEMLTALEPDMTFALLGTTRKRAAKEGGDYMSIDYGLTAMLIDALSNGPGARFIYLSAVGTSSTSSGSYMKARWLAEEHLRASGLPYLIARPSFIVGDRDEARHGENIGSRMSDAALHLVGALGARRATEKYLSIRGQELGTGLVRAAMDWQDDARVLYSPDLRS